MFGWFKNAAIHVSDEQQFEGMTKAADFIIRGLSPHYESDDHTVPPAVVAVINKLEADIKNASDLSARNGIYLMGLHRLGEAIGNACAEKALRK